LDDCVFIFNSYPVNADNDQLSYFLSSDVRDDRQETDLNVCVGAHSFECPFSQFVEHFFDFPSASPVMNLAFETFFLCFFFDTF